jgi:hypothetical protein
MLRPGYSIAGLFMLCNPADPTIARFIPCHRVGYDAAHGQKSNDF